MTNPNNEVTNLSNGGGVGGDLKDYFTLQEVADYHGVTVPAVRKWIVAGLLPAHRDGRRMYIKVDDVESFERPAEKKPGRPVGSKNRQQQASSGRVVRINPAVDPVEPGATRRGLQIEYGTSADEIASLIETLGGALTEVGNLVYKLDIKEPETGTEALLRGDLRASRRVLRRCFEFIRDDSNIVFRAQDDGSRDGLLKDVEQELRGG